MPRRSAMRGALKNFLSTYITRYSTFDGYWLFGFIVSDLEKIEIDLLDPPTRETQNPLETANLLASTRFKEQVQKWGLSISCMVDASVAMLKSPVMRSCLIEDYYRDGFDITFEVYAQMDNGKRYQCHDSVFVAPHDPRFERRSARTAHH